MTCPKCRSESVSIQTFQEQKGSVTKTRTRFKVSEKRHGFLWWLFIGWWWKFIKLILWIVAFPFMAILRLLRRRDYTGSSKSTARMHNKISYKSVCTCQNCGHTWTA